MCKFCGCLDIDADFRDSLDERKKKHISGPVISMDMAVLFNETSNRDDIQDMLSSFDGALDLQYVFTPNCLSSTCLLLPCNLKLKLFRKRRQKAFMIY